jgi:uncharacterized protein
MPSASDDHIEIWDGHGHLTGVAGATPAERLGTLVKYADRMGIARLCVCMGMNFAYDPSPERLRADNDEVLEALRAWPQRAFGFVYVSPKHPQVSLAEIDRCVRDGPMVGVKLWVAEHCNLPSLDPIIARAAELKVPVLQHTWIKTTGNLPGESTPFELVELAKRHPQATLICGHSGGNWELGLRAIRPCRNVYTDLSGGDPTAGFVEMAVAELGAERLIYGSDFGGRSYASQLAKVLDADISESAKRLILAGNLKRILQPILQRKGVKI